MQTGTIKTWKSDRGFGFARPNAGGEDVFVHIGRVTESVEELRVGQRIQFEIGTNLRRGKSEAQNVTLID